MNLKMGMPRKRSRRISVDGLSYRWIALYQPVDYCSAPCPLRVIVQSQVGRGQVLIAQFQSSDKDEIGQVWMFPRYGSEVTPGIVAEIIRAATKAGWEPKTLGRRPFVIDGEPFLRLPADPNKPPPNSEDDLKRRFLLALREIVRTSEIVPPTDCGNKQIDR